MEKVIDLTCIDVQKKIKQAFDKMTPDDKCDFKQMLYEGYCDLCHEKLREGERCYCSPAYDI